MSVTVKDLMAAAVIVAGHRETLGEVREKMSTHHISAVPHHHVVVMDGDRIAGMLSTFDLLRLIEQEED